MNDEAFGAAMKLVRLKLQPATRADESLRALAAAAFFAIAALTFCASAILAPPNETLPPARLGVL